MKISLASDHTGVDLRYEIINFVKTLGHEAIDMGPESKERTDYPIYGVKVALEIAKGKADCGILICGTGVGISIAANKIKGIRAVVCSDPYTAKLSKQHNNTNILSLGARVVGSELAKMIVYEWLNAKFEGGRHIKRLEMIEKIEDQYLLDLENRK